MKQTPAGDPFFDGIGARLLGVVAAGLLALSASAVGPTTLADQLESTLTLPADGRAAAVSLRPTYSLETADVSYPSWFLGKWKTKSTLQSVLAPAGEELFAVGRNGAEELRRARLEVGQPLAYDVRWLRDQQGDVVVDRPYNVESISRATLGSTAVQNTAEDGPNHITTYLKPAGAAPGVVYKADLRVVARHTDAALEARPNFFACAETTRQTVTAVADGREQGKPRTPLIKEIETIVTYELDPADPQKMRGYQRTATFLVPDAAYTGDSSLAEVAAARLASVNGRLVAIDVRVYELEYDKIPS